MRSLSAIAGLAATLIAGQADAQNCRGYAFDGNDYTICEVHAGQDVRLFLDAPGGGNLGSFGVVNQLLAREGKTLAFAMNGGMYQPDRSPVGLLILNGTERAPIVTSDGPGNFGLLPNGVFCIAAKGFSVIESRHFAAKPPECRYATQSGPLLVISGQLHPRFLRESDSLYVRNGVGVAKDGQTAWFAISSAPVNFDSFARMFRDGLGTPEALYFDGSVSRLYAPALGRRDFGFAMGPIVGLVVPKR